MAQGLKQPSQLKRAYAGLLTLSAFTPTLCTRTGQSNYSTYSYTTSSIRMRLPRVPWVVAQILLSSLPMRPNVLHEVNCHLHGAYRMETLRIVTQPLAQKRSTVTSPRYAWTQLSKFTGRAHISHHGVLVGWQSGTYILASSANNKGRHHHTRHRPIP